MANVGTLSVKFTGDASQLEQTFTRVGVKANLFSSAIQGGLRAAASAAAGFVKSAISIASENENTLTSFKNLTGSIGEAKALYADLLKFSSQTPFSSKEIQSGATTLLGFGLSAKDASQAIKELGAAAAANADTDLKRLVVSFGQIQGAGVAMTKDLREFVNNGIPIYQILSETLDVSVGKINDLASSGKITADVITNAFRQSAAEGGRFANTLADQSQTLAGLTSTLKDNYAITLGSLAERLLPAAKEAAKGFNDVLLQMQEYFGSSAGEEWALKLAAAVRAAFQSTGDELKQLILSIELAVAKFFAAINPISDFAKTKLIAAQAAFDGFSSTMVSFGDAYNEALTNIKRDQEWNTLLGNLNSSLNAWDLYESELLAVGNSTKTLTPKVKELSETYAEFNARMASFLPNLQTYAEFQERISNIKPVQQLLPDIGNQLFIAPEIDSNLKEDPLKKIEEQAEAHKKLADIMRAAGEVANQFGSALNKAHQDGITGARAYAKAAIESAKEVIAAQIREGVVAAASKALASVPFPFGVILAGIAGGAAEALFRGLVSKISIPAFGDGGVVYGPTLALIGEKGPEEVVPLGRKRSSGSNNVTIRGVQYGADTYWQNANAGLVGRLVYGPQ